VSDLYYPLHSLEKGNWFKLICGASFQDLPAIRSLALAYTLAGIDCIDLAADSAAIAAAKEGIAVAKTLMQAATAGRTRTSLPLLMVSLNDGEDPHFRKAEFDSTLCPSDCPRPCEKICPANAIAFEALGFAGVQDSRCYGCGRCLPVCPSNLIVTRSYVFRQGAIAPLVREMNVDAIEIHTQVGRERDFQRLWQEIAPLSQNLKVLAISCPDDLELIEYLFYLYELISPLPCALIWQTDGRPMSGDIGRGATRAAIELAQKVLKSHLPGYVQLAGGTNHHTVPKLKTMGLVREGESETSISNSHLKISGVAYGSYARTLLSPVFEQLNSARLEECPQLLWQAVTRASSLVGQLKNGLKASADNLRFAIAAKDLKNSSS
jgi:Fe-S-cluster-containing hydrogenase component 2